MKFFGKLNLRRFAKVVAVAAVSGSLFWGGSDVVVNAASDGMKAFREAYMAQRADTRMVDQDLTLISTNFHLDIDSKAQVTADGVLRMSGDLAWTYTNLNKNYSTNSHIPFFIEQVGNNELSLYTYRDGQWTKMYLPGLPAGIATIWKTTDFSILKENLDTVKNVEVIKDTSDMRIMKVTLDGKKIAKILEKNTAGSFANLPSSVRAEQREIFDRWLTAIRANDITFAWTVNKPNWETVTAAFDLTDIMRVYCRYVLDQSAAGRISLTDEERGLLDAMGYYSELKSYTTHISPREEIMIQRPADIVYAPEDDNALDDIFAAMTTAVRR